MTIDPQTCERTSMVVTCESMEGFLEILSVHNRVHLNTIYALESKQQDPTKTKEEVIFQATTIIRAEDGSEFFLQLGIHCGKNYLDADGDRSGSEVCQDLMVRLREFCLPRNWKILPGRLGT